MRSIKGWFSIIALVSGMVSGVSGGAQGVTTPDVEETPPPLTRHSPRLSGTLRGTYTSQELNADVGTHYTLLGSGRLRPLGSVRTSGHFNTLGYTASHYVTWQLTLRGARGSLTLTLTGPMQERYTPPPNDFRYTVTGVSGQYRKAFFPGSIHLILRPEMRQDANGEFVMTFGP
ncbi:MAG: hypothetical protein M3Y56_13135 [Armatimonadota bacterium]|nr:hypothetical protein [Armatimonadota bacterium]